MDEQLKKPISQTIIVAIEKAPSSPYSPPTLQIQKKKLGEG